MTWHCQKCGSPDKDKRGKCKPCARERVKRWKQAFPEKVKAYSEMQRATYPEKLKSSQAKSYAKNPQKYKLKSSKWKIENPDKVKDSARRCFKENYANDPGRFIAHVHNRRALKLNATPKWFEEFDELIVKEAGTLCALRKKMLGIEHHVDHIVPLKGKTVCGFHIGCNIRVIPAMVNRSKNNHYWPDMP